MDDSGPVVIVELAAEAASSPNVGALIDACTVALRRGQCTSARDVTNQSADAVAIVTFRSSDPTEVLVEVRVGQGNASTSRDISFRREDSEGEKWRSIGFTIASLAGALGVQEAPRPVHPEPTPLKPPVPEKKPAPRPVAPTRLSPFRIGARLEVGPGLDRGPVRFGGALSADYDLPVRVLGVWALAGHALRSSAVGNVDMGWTRFGVGMSAAAPIPPAIEARVALGVVLERIVASETEATTQVEQSRSRWLSGLELDGSIRLPAATRVGGVLGGYVVRLSGGTAVVSHGVELASSPAVEGGFFVGLEVRL
jgi:hypothetical protein